MPAEARTLAIDVGATRTRLALVADGVIAERTEARTRELIGSDRSIADGLVACAESLVERSGISLPDAVGLGMAASIDLAGGVLQPRDFGIPAGPGLRDRLGGAFDRPIAVDNDANLAALAEQRLGAARGCDFAAVMTLGTNIGLGLILDGEVYRGSRGAAGEVGLLLVPAATVEDGPVSRLAEAGAFGLNRTAAPRGYAWMEELVGGGALATASGDPARHVLTREAQADPALRPLGQRAVEGWALIIADLAVLLDLEVIVLCGGVALDAGHLLDALRRRVAELAAPAPEIRLGSLGPDAELLGADLLARAALDAGSAPHARAGLTAHATGERR